MYATIPIRWSDAKQVMTIGDRQGTYPGMLGTGTFRIVWVSEGQGTGVSLTAHPDKTVEYSGGEIRVAG